MHHPLPVKKKIRHIAELMGRTIIWVCYHKALQDYGTKFLSEVTDLKIIRKKSENSPSSVFPIGLHWVHHSVIFSPILVSLSSLLNCRRPNSQFWILPQERNWRNALWCRQVKDLREEIGVRWEAELFGCCWPLLFVLVQKWSPRRQILMFIF